MIAVALGRCGDSYESQHLVGVYLRNALIRASGRNVEECIFTKEQNGKPRAWGADGEEIYYSVSHSHGIAVCAVAADDFSISEENGYDELPMTSDTSADSDKRASVLVLPVAHSGEIGADIELVNTGNASRYKAIAKRYLAVNDTDDLSYDDFFRLWTRREALGKLTGNGVINPGVSEDEFSFFTFKISSDGQEWYMSVCFREAPGKRFTLC